MSYYYKQAQEQKDFLNNLPLSPERNSNLCKLLSEENISIVYSDVKTARFNVISRILTIPKWRNMSAHVIDRIIIHEVGHALFTTDWVELTAYESKQVRSATNILEDRRVDNLMKKRFPGVAKDYFEAAKDIVSLDLFKLEGKDINKMCFLDRANMLSKIGVNKGIIGFNKEEKNWLKEIDSTKSTEEAKALALKILAAIAEVKIKEETKMPESDPDPEENEEVINTPEENDESEENNKSPEENDESEENFGIEVESDDENDDIKSDPEETDPEENDENDDTLPTEGDNSNGEDTTGEVEPNEVPEIDSNEEIETDNLFEDMQEEIDTYNCGSNNIVRDMPINPDNYIINLRQLMILNKANHYENHFMTAKMKSEVKKDALQLFREFSTKKQANVQNVFYSNRGSLDMNRLSEYRTNDEIFERKMKRVSNDSDHKFFFLIDYSCSMRDGNIAFAARQLAVFRAFCKMAKVEFSAYLFCTSTDYPNSKQSKMLKIDQGLYEYYSDNMKLVEIANENQSDRDFDSMISRTVNSAITGVRMGQTPLTSSIKIVRIMMETEKAQTPDKKLNFILLTDGQENLTLGENLILEDAGKVQYNVGKQAWTAQLRMMKRVANSIVGFAIHEGSTFLNLAKQSDPNNYELHKTLRNTISREGYTNATVEGFDSMFLIKSYIRTYTDRDMERDYDFDRITVNGATAAFKKKNQKTMVQKKITAEISKIIA